MKSVARVGALVSWVLIVLLAARSHIDVVDGVVHPAAGLRPHPLTGQTIKKVLPSGADLSNMFDQSFGSASALSSAGSEIMYGRSVRSGPHECVGVAHMLAQDAYSESNVQEVAREISWNTSPYDQDPAVIVVEEGVVAVPTMPDADALFAEFTEQWRHCAGATVTFADGFFDYDISDVRVIDSVLVATVRQRINNTTIRQARAIGVRMNCLVDVAVDFYHDRPFETSDGHGKSAVDVTRLMMDKVSGLS